MADDPDVYGRHHYGEPSTRTWNRVLNTGDTYLLRAVVCSTPVTHRREPGDFVTPALHAALLNGGRHG